MRIALSLLLGSLLLAACGEEPSVEQQIIATLHDMEEAAEAGEHLDFMAYVADSFEGQQGTMERRDFHRFMIFQINQHRRLSAQFFPIHVREIGNTKAAANFRLLVTGGGGLLPENGQLFDVETEWVHDRDDWLLLKADWETVRLPDIPATRN